jgi:hypothetical protein
MEQSMSFSNSVSLQIFFLWLSTRLQLPAPSFSWSLFDLYWHALTHKMIIMVIYLHEFYRFSSSYEHPSDLGTFRFNLRVVTFFISKIPIFALISTVFHSFENLWLYLEAILAGNIYYFVVSICIKLQWYFEATVYCASASEFWSHSLLCVGVWILDVIHKIRTFKYLKNCYFVSIYFFPGVRFCHLLTNLFSSSAYLRL